MYVQTNGQWSMVNACTPQSEPILGTGGEKKFGLCTFVLYAIYLTSVQSSDDGISLPPPMVPNLCLDKKLGFDGPRCVASFPRTGFLYRVLCPPAKQTSVDTQTLKYLSLVYFEVVWSYNIQPFACIVFVPSSIW